MHTAFIAAFAGSILSDGVATDILVTMLHCCSGNTSQNFTIMDDCICSGEPGLEVRAGQDNSPSSWVPCDPVEGAITVNIGDALQYWSDGTLKSTFHRVRMPNAEEYQASQSDRHAKVEVLHWRGNSSGLLTGL